MRILVTGCAGFIGFHVVSRLLTMGLTVVGIDNLNDYYDIKLKEDRLKLLSQNQNFIFYKISIEDSDQINQIFDQNNITHVINLAAQAGVRYSLENPMAYINSNILGFTNILEACRHHGVAHLIYASSSSVYGANRKMPFSEEDSVDHPVSLYAATKKSNELLAHTYSHLYHLPTTGLRFFTVYGPWGRPDMAYFSFTQSILKGEAIKVFNYGDMKRDFTYIDDIVEGVIRLIEHIPTSNPNWDPFNPQKSSSKAPYSIYNIGNHSPVSLLEFITILGEKLGKDVNKELLPMQKGDVNETFADISEIEREVSFKPSTSLGDGLGMFVKWYKKYYNV